MRNKTELKKDCLRSKNTRTIGLDCTVGDSSSVTRRVLAEIVYEIYYEVWAVFILEYELKCLRVNE